MASCNLLSSVGESARKTNPLIGPQFATPHSTSPQVFSPDSERSFGCRHCGSGNAPLAPQTLVPSSAVSENASNLSHFESIVSLSWASNSLVEGASLLVLNSAAHLALPNRQELPTLAT